MPSWEGIADVSPTPNCVWLSRPTDDSLWKPLRKVDCRALNEDKGTEQVYIDGGRQTADPINGVIRHNFYNDVPTTQLTSATWFVREENKNSSSKNDKYVLHPMSPLDRVLVEDLYQRAVAATSSLGSGIEEILKEKYVLQDDSEYHIMVVKTGNTLSMKKKSKGWFGASSDLQRGWGEYVVDGEEEEMLLGPVDHVLFVVHGIGEAMWSRDIKSKSVVGEVNKARIAIQKMQFEEWKTKCDKARKTGNVEPPPPNRIEVLPIEWYHRIHSSSNTLMTSLKATTIQSIPALRAIANDVIFDVLMYMTPTFCQSVLDCVTDQIASLYEGLQKVHPDWKGKCSLVGHSLGSVIVWDLLCILKENREAAEQKPQSDKDVQVGQTPSLASLLHHGVSIETEQSSSSPHGYQAYATTDEHANTAANGSWGPTLPKPMQKHIPFDPEFTLFLGSPIGLFLTLRGAHAVFDEMTTLMAGDRELNEEKEDELSVQNDNDASSSISWSSISKLVADDEQNDNEHLNNSVVSPFTLPSGSMYNIFHPSDPVAYRIEPLLLPQNTSNVQVPSPKYLVREGQGVRFHVKARELTRAIAEKTNTSWSSLVNQVTEQAVGALSSELVEQEPQNKKKRQKKLKPNRFPLGGKSSRVDYQLQPGVIDNEYFSAVMAHSSYFVNTDVLDFVLDLIDEDKIKEKDGLK